MKDEAGTCLKCNGTGEVVAGDGIGSGSTHWRAPCPDCGDYRSILLRDPEFGPYEVESGSLQDLLYSLRQWLGSYHGSWAPPDEDSDELWDQLRDAVSEMACIFPTAKDE